MCVQRVMQKISDIFVCPLVYKIQVSEGAMQADHKHSPSVQALEAEKGLRNPRMLNMKSTAKSRLNSRIWQRLGDTAKQSSANENSLAPNDPNAADRTGLQSP